MGNDICRLSKHVPLNVGLQPITKYLEALWHISPLLQVKQS